MQSQRKFQKKKERERLVAQRKHQEVQRRIYAQKFPVFEFVKMGDHVPEAFVELIKEAAAKINFRDRKAFSVIEQEIYENVKKFGIRDVIEDLNRIDPQICIAWGLRLGEILFQFARPRINSWIPFNDAQVIVLDKKINVRLSSLCTEKAPGGTIYYSRHKPKVLIDGVLKIVGFSTHAIQQTCARICPRWQTYSGMGDLFGFFNYCLHFEPCRLTDGNPAITFYKSCGRQFWNHSYVINLLGGEIAKDDKRYYYCRVGYCPVFVHGDFVVAKTLLYPGYRTTPEYQAIIRANLPRQERQKLIEAARYQDIDTLQKTGDFTLLKFFHKYVPQVIISDKNFYIYR